GTYSDAFTNAGISGVKIEMTEERGWSRSQSHGHRMARRIPTVVGRIAWKGPQNADDFRFLKSLTTRTPKITLPGPCYIHYRAGRANISRDVSRPRGLLVRPGRSLHPRNALARGCRLPLPADRRNVAGEARRSACASIAHRA